MQIVQDGRQEVESPLMNTALDFDTLYQVVSNMNATFEKDVDSFWRNFISETVKVNPTQGSSFKLSKAKFDQSRVVSAGIIH